MATAIERFDFRGDALDVVRTEDGRVLVSIRRVCEALGIDLATQLAKLKSKRWAVVGLIPMTGPDGKTYETACLDLDALPMWLATIEPSRVAEAVRPKLEGFQTDAARVLADHFLGRRGGDAAAALAPLAASLARVTDTLASQSTTLANLTTHALTTTTAIGDVSARLVSLERRSEERDRERAFIGPRGCRDIKSRVAALVDLRPNDVSAPKMRSRVYSDLRAEIGVAMAGKVDMFPATALPAALTWLDVQVSRARELAAARRQGSLFAVA